MSGLLLDRFHPPRPVERHHAIALGIGHIVGENRRTRGPPARFLQGWPQTPTVENVVSEDQHRRIRAHELSSDEEGLREPLRPRLLGVRQREAELCAVSQDGSEARQILRCRDDEDLADTREHQGGERIEDERLVVHRHQLLADAEGQRVQPRPGAAGQDDAFSHGSRGSVYVTSFDRHAQLTKTRASSQRRRAFRSEPPSSRTKPSG